MTIDKYFVGLRLKRLKGGSSGGRDAPSAATTASDQVAHSINNGRAAPAATEDRSLVGLDAYKAGIKRRKRENWLRQLSDFVTGRFNDDCERMMAFLEVVTRAHNAVHDWASLSKEDRKTLDWLDERMRNWGLAA